MEPRIETIKGKKLIGKRLKMSFSENKTAELWRNFMPRRTEIKNNIGTELYSLQIYDPSHFTSFNLNTEFEKWALIEVLDFDILPEGMEAFILTGGAYVVFIHKGLNSDNSTFRYIFESWLPNSDFQLDNRPHFEILGNKYKNGQLDSEEEVWIPVKIKEECKH